MISAIVVNFHTAALLRTLIHQLLSEQRIDQVIVADNSGEIAAGDSVPRAPQLRVISNERNIGFGPAVNQALAHADGEWILVVNPDVRLGEKCLERLLNAADRYRSPLMGPRAYWDDQLQFRLPPATGACLWLDFANRSAERYVLDAELLSFYWTLRHERFWEARTPFFEPFLSGGCLLVKKEWVDSNGGRLFDDDFFLYFEDTDLCVRALMDGVRPLCVPDAHVVHYYDQSPPASSGTKSHLMDRSCTGFFEKHYPGLSSPVLDEAGFSVNAIDLDEVTGPPIFRAGRGVSWEGCFFEIGVNPYFVPFAQARLSGELFEFPGHIWAGLSAGSYYGRVRDSVLGTLKVWQWKKS